MVFAAEGEGRGLFQFNEIVRTEMGQVMTFRIGPQRFDGIQFRRIGGEIFDMQIRNRVQILGYVIRAMDRQAIPQQHDWPPKMPTHLSENRHDRGFVDRRFRLQKMMAGE